MARLQVGVSIVDLGDCHGIFRGRTEGGQYRFQLLDGSDSFGYYTKKDKIWEAIQVKKLEAAELYSKGQLYIESYVFYIEDNNLVRGKVYNTNPLELIVKGKKITKDINDVFTFEAVAGTKEEREATSRAMHGLSTSDTKDMRKKAGNRANLVYLWL